MADSAMRDSIEISHTREGIAGIDGAGVNSARVDGIGVNTTRTRDDNRLVVAEVR